MSRMSQSYAHDVVMDRHSMLTTLAMLPVLSSEDADDMPVELRSRLPGTGGGLSEAVTCDAAATSWDDVVVPDLVVTPIV